MDKRVFWQQLTRLVQWELVVVVIENKWWERLKDRIRAFITKYSQRLALDKDKKVMNLEDSLSWEEVDGDSLEIAVTKQAALPRSGN